MILHLNQTFIFCRMLKWMTLMTLGSTCILFLRRPFLERTLMLTRMYALEVIREMMLLQGIVVFVELLIMQDCCCRVILMVNSWLILPIFIIDSYVYSDAWNHLRKDVKDMKEVTSVRLFPGVCNVSKCILKNQDAAWCLPCLNLNGRSYTLWSWREYAPEKVNT